MTITGIITAIVIGAVIGALARLILPGRGFTAANGHPPMSLVDGPTLRAAVGSVLYLILVALLALGIATVIRDAATSIGLVLALLYLVPLVAQAVGDPNGQRLLRQVAPMTAGLAIQATTDLPSQPISPWAGLGVLAAWAAAAVLVAAVTIRRRDG